MLSLKNLLKPQGALFKLLSYKGIHIDSDLIKEEMGRHPDAPSLLAVSDVLTALGIENTAFRAELEELKDIDTPFLAHVNTDKGDLLVVTRVEEDCVYVSSEKWEKHKIKMEEFKTLYTGVVMVVEASEEFKGSPLKTFLKDYRNFGIVVCLCLLLGLAVVFNTGYLANVSWQLLALTVFKTAGLITSILLLVQSIDKNNPLVKVICQGGDEKDCNSILSSDAAKVFDGLSWSEVGFFYFAGTWLLLLFGGGSVLSWQLLAVLNIVSLPYTFYSVYYQSRVAKQWCVLCTTVQALLWLEFLPLITVSSKAPLWFNVNGNWGIISAAIICLLLPVVLWSMVKPLFLQVQKITPLKRQVRQFKYNADLFAKLLKDQPKYSVPDPEWSIVLGNKDAESIITMISGPYCSPCSIVHKEVEEFVEQNSNVQVRIVFKTQNAEHDKSTHIGRHLMSLNALEDQTQIQKALHDWYGQATKNYEDWAKRFPVQLNEREYEKLAKQKDWCDMAGINATPTLMVNGYRLPDMYQLQDLKYMLN